MSPPIIVPPGSLSGVAHPSDALRARLGRLPGLKKNSNLEAMLEATTAIDSLAKLLTEAIEKNTSKDGRIDMRDVAVHVLSEMRNNQR